MYLITKVPRACVGTMVVCGSKRPWVGTMVGCVWFKKALSGTMVGCVCGVCWCGGLKRPCVGTMVVCVV